MDIVIDLRILADTEAYHTLEDNFRNLGSTSDEEREGRSSGGAGRPGRSMAPWMVLSYWLPRRGRGGGFSHSVTHGTISALNVPHCSIVFDLYQVTEIQAELLGDAGVHRSRQARQHRELHCLKAFAFHQRFERKDAHDLIYRIDMRRKVWMQSPWHSGRRAPASTAPWWRVVSILRRRFAVEDSVEGFRKDGPGLPWPIREG